MADDNPSVIIIGARRGRPRVTEPRSTVSTWVPASAHDRLIQLAKEHEVSVSEMVKSLLLVQLDLTKLT